MAGILAQFLFLIDREITKLYKGLPNCEWNIDIIQGLNKKGYNLEGSSVLLIFR